MVLVTCRVCSWKREGPARALRTDVCTPVLEMPPCTFRDVKAKSRTHLDCEHVSLSSEGNQRGKGASAYPSFGESVHITRRGPLLAKGKLHEQNCQTVVSVRIDGPGLTPTVLGVEQIQACFFSIESIFLLRVTQRAWVA